MPEAWLAILLPAALMTVALGLERLERHLNGPPHLDPKRKIADSSAEVPRSAPRTQSRTVGMASRLALVMASSVVLVVGGSTALVLGRSAPAPVPIPLFTAAPPAAVVPPPPVVDDIVVPAPVPVVAQQVARPVVAHVVTRPVLSAWESGSDRVRDGVGPSASSSGKSQANRSHGGGSSTSQKKGNAKDKKSNSHGNKGGRKG